MKTAKKSSCDIKDNLIEQYKKTIQELINKLAKLEKDNKKLLKR